MEHAGLRLLIPRFEGRLHVLLRSSRPRLPAFLLVAALAGVGLLPSTAHAVSEVAEPAFDRICSDTPLDTTREVRRISGQNRYETSIAVARVRFGDRQGCEVSVASGRTFPDAITAAANLSYGPLLLVPGTSLPSSVRAEIVRLDPDGISTYGGRAVIVPDVTRQLSALAGGVIIAHGGANRYATAAKASYDHRTGVTAYIAAGHDFPDALSAAPLVRSTGGSFLLVEQNHIPVETRTALGYLRPSRIVVIGGTGSVSAAVERGLRNYTTGGVTRIQGVDRYETAVKIADELEPWGASQVTIVSGRSFPDALSAASLGAGPVILVEPDGIPEVVRAALTRHSPTTIVIIGGTGVVSSDVEAELAHYLRPLD